MYACRADTPRPQPLYGSRHSVLGSPTHLHRAPRTPGDGARREGEGGALLWRQGSMGCCGGVSDWEGLQNNAAAMALRI